MHRNHNPSLRGLGELVGLPQAQQFEAPSSWITRAALSQGISPDELLLFMGFKRKDIQEIDTDLLLTSTSGLAALNQAGSLTSMPVAARIFTNLRRLEAKAKVLLKGTNNASRSRFCPVCIKNQRYPHLEVHCRFSVWRVCPLHQCLMEDVCSHCGQELIFPFDMRKAGQRGDGIANLGDCRQCGGKLGSIKPLLINDLEIDYFSRIRLQNGRALLAGLYTNHLIIDHAKLVPVRFCVPYLKFATFWGKQPWPGLNKRNSKIISSSSDG